MKTGFLEESEGVRSATRLIMVWLAVLASILVVTTAYYVGYLIRHDKPVDQYVILALAGCIGALVANGIIAINRRNGSEP